MRYDVIVVGAGPAGLAFARSLSGSGLRLALVDGQPLETLAQPPADGREIALTHRSIETLQALGAWAHVDPADIAPLRQLRVLNGESSFALLFDTQGSDEDRLGSFVPNHCIRRALFRTVETQPQLELFSGVRVLSARATRDGATVTLADSRTLEGRLLVAADSRFSLVREQLGITAEINRLGWSTMVCRVAHEHEHGGVSTAWFDHGHTIAMLPLNGRVSSAVLMQPTAEINRLAALDPGALGAEITRRYRGRLGAMRVVEGPHVYGLAMTYARRFATSSAALIGDASVGMHPVTAHGFNLGLKGASTLAKLIGHAAQRGTDIAAPSLLHQFEAAHRLATRPLYTVTKLWVRLYTDERVPARLARHATLRAGARLPLFRQTISRLLMQH